MSLLGFVIVAAHAATTTAAQPHHQGGFLSLLPMLLLIALVFYFLMIRPQKKRANQQKSLMEKLTVGDEIVTVGGIVGKLLKIRDGFITLSIANGVEITMRKTAIESVLPKGTMDS